MSKTIKPLILLGAGCHARVVLALIQKAELPILGVCDPELYKNGIKEWRGITVLGSDSVVDEFSPEDVRLINGIGQRPKDKTRQYVFDKFKTKGFYFPTLLHPQACVDASAILEEGVQVMAGAVVQVDCHIKQNVIINTRASVDHDCVISEHVHIAPGATLCGNVNVGAGAFIASGATLIQRVNIGVDAIVGAGASIVRDVAASQSVIPASIRYC